MIKDEELYSRTSKRLNTYRELLRDFESNEYRKENTLSNLWWKQHDILLNKIKILQELLDDCLVKIVIYEIATPTRKLVAKTPLKLYPNKTKDSLWTVENKTLGLYVFEESYEDLVIEVINWLVFLWEEYALESYNCLSEDAWKVKDNLLKQFEEVYIIEEKTND